MGKIVSFEGLPGVGKSTLIESIRRQLEEKGISVVIIGELGESETKKSEIWQPVMNVFTYSEKKFFRQYDPHLDTFFSQAVRYLICYEVIQSVKNKYDVLLEDRGIDTYMSYALAGFNKELGLSFDNQYDKLSILNSMNTIETDITIRLKDSVDNCIKRSISRGERQVLEEDTEYLYYVDKAYDFLERKNPNRIHSINVKEKSAESVAETAIRILINNGIISWEG